MNREELQKEFDSIVDKIKNDELCITGKRALDAFKYELKILRDEKIPASIKYHHTDGDGLLKHTIEVCHILEMFEPDNTYLLTAGLLHDIGKIYDYTITKDLDGNLVSEDCNCLFSKESDKNINHSQYAYAKLLVIDEFLADLIGCHMGKKEWGAVFDLDVLLNTKKDYIEKPFYLLHFADMISAKLLLGE